MPPKSREGDIVLSFSGKWVSWAHTVVAYCAFLGALIVGLQLHYHKIVENEYYGFPQEWFPSVSATIGDRFPERSVFQIFIAITSGPRFALVSLFYLLTARPGYSLPKFVFGVGIFRTFTCGGWTYVTSTDDHGWHDIFMISYLVATLPWTVGCIALSPRAHPEAIKWRKRLAGAFFGTLVPLIYFFIQHKIHRIAGAYTIYAFFEWALILLDVAFDAVTALDFEGFELVVRDVQGASRGDQIADAVLEKENAKLAQVAASGVSMASAVDAAADVYLGFVFWSMLTSLGLTIWYFPLWHMGISGYEAVLVITLSPYLLCSASPRSVIIKNIRYIHLLSLIGLTGFLVKTPELRLMFVSFGTGLACLAWSAAFYAERNNASRLENRALAWTIGLIVSSLAKFANHTNNPVWPIVNADNGGWNKLGLALALAAILVRSPHSSFVDTSSYTPNGRPVSPTLAGLGLGGLIFALHSLLSDSSTMISWTWKGFPIRGPIAAHGVLVLFAMGAGVVQAISRSEQNLPDWPSFGIVALGAFLLTAFGHWKGMLGGLSLAFALLALAPSLIASAVRSGPLSFGLAFLIYNILVLAHVWVVAYAFVPGGPLLREHTDWVMAATVGLIGAGVLAAIGARGRDKQTPRRSRADAASKLKSNYVYILGIAELLAVAVAYLRFPTNDYIPYHTGEKMITAGIWTVHFSLDNDMWSSERRMRDLIKEMELDVVGLLESDLQRIIMGNRDTTQYLAEDLGMYVDAGPGPNKHTWGAALLSKFPILNSTHHLLPSPVGELAPAIHATIDAYGEHIDVVVFHSGQEEDPEDRRLQSLYLSKLMKDSPRPIILLSYLVIKPHEGNYHTYVGEASSMRDIDSTDWDRWCEYILYKGIKRSGYARVSRSTITDTELQVGKFIVGQPEGTDEQIQEANVPEGERFPGMFRGQGQRGHAYHVFEEPRYYH